MDLSTIVDFIHAIHGSSYGLGLPLGEVNAFWEGFWPAFWEAFWPAFWDGYEFGRNL